MSSLKIIVASRNHKLLSQDQVKERMQNKQGHAWLRKTKDALKVIKFNDNNASQEINVGVKKFKLIADKYELWGEHD